MTSPWSTFRFFFSFTFFTILSYYFSLSLSLSLSCFLSLGSSLHLVSVRVSSAILNSFCGPVLRIIYFPSPTIHYSHFFCLFLFTKWTLFEIPRFFVVGQFFDYLFVTKRRTSNSNGVAFEIDFPATHVSVLDDGLLIIALRIEPTNVSIKNINSLTQRRVIRPYSFLIIQFFCSYRKNL